MTPIPIQRPYNNWLAVSRVMATIPAMLAEGDFTPSRAREKSALSDPALWTPRPPKPVQSEVPGDGAAR